MTSTTNLLKLYNQTVIKSDLHNNLEHFTSIGKTVPGWSTPACLTKKNSTWWIKYSVTSEWCAFIFSASTTINKYADKSVCKANGPTKTHEQVPRNRISLRTNRVNSSNTSTSLTFIRREANYVEPVPQIIFKLTKPFVSETPSLFLSLRTRSPHDIWTTLTKPKSTKFQTVTGFSIETSTGETYLFIRFLQILWWFAK